MEHNEAAWTPSKDMVRHRRGRIRRAEVNAAEKRGLQECKERRARVLAFPDVASDLTLRPLYYTTPEHWNGFVPPATYGGKPNESPRRTALISIVKTVAQLEKEAGDALVQG